MCYNSGMRKVTEYIIYSRGVVVAWAKGNSAEEVCKDLRENSLSLYGMVLTAKPMSKASKHDRAIVYSMFMNKKASE